MEKLVWWNSSSNNKSDLPVQFSGYIITIHALDSEQATILEADPLTNKELEVLELMVQGFTNNQISRQLYMSLGTVKVHIRSILNKSCASDRTQAAVLAMRAGLID